MNDRDKNQPVAISAQDIDKVLPQTQCGECTYDGCLPYAKALAEKKAPINLCPPGGKDTIIKLGELLDIDPASYLNEHTTRTPAIAQIIESECIGCTKCIQACPVDAIIGAGKMMHSILTHECTGCGLCVAPCPVDCIEMHEVDNNPYNKDKARMRYQAKKNRVAQKELEKVIQYRDKTSNINQSSSVTKLDNEHSIDTINNSENLAHNNKTYDKSNLSEKSSVDDKQQFILDALKRSMIKKSKAK